MKHKSENSYKNIFFYILCWVTGCFCKKDLIYELDQLLNQFYQLQYFHVLNINKLNKIYIYLSTKLEHNIHSICTCIISTVSTVLNNRLQNVYINCVHALHTHPLICMHAGSCRAYLKRVHFKYVFGSNVVLEIKWGLY